MPLTTTNANDLNLSRRGFLRASSTAAGGLLLTLFLDPPAAAQERSEAPSQPKAYPPAAFVEIRPDGKIVIQVNRLEFGQGVQTALPMILADEMDADWSQVVAELAPAADVYKDPIRGIQMVGGSGSIANSFQQYRELGAKTRAMLIAAAAERWGVTPQQCRRSDRHSLRRSGPSFLRLLIPAFALCAKNERQLVPGRALCSIYVQNYPEFESPRLGGKSDACVQAAISK